MNQRERSGLEMLHNPISYFALSEFGKTICRLGIIFWLLADGIQIGPVAFAQEPFAESAISPIADATGIGHLIAIGGGLLPNNQAVFNRLIEYGGGVEKARFVLVPTASVSKMTATLFRKELAAYGVPEDRIEVLDVMETNAAAATHDPAILEKVRQATAVYMTGGDQRRLVRCLRERDGSDTPLLKEIRQVYQRGGLIAGTSAGASAQSEIMLAVSGLPDMLVDEGMDALDFGLTSDPAKRGLLITRGLGFQKEGIIDQHFMQYRGRLGRLTRATAEGKIPFGFGIDKNSAVVINPDGRISIVAGSVIIVEPGTSQGQDSHFGYEIQDVNISLLGQGDEFDPLTKKSTVSPTKTLLKPEDLAFNGNFLIGDIGYGYAITSALISGLAENHRQKQDAIVLQFHGDTSHGYRFQFRKRPTTRAYLDSTSEESSYCVLDVQLDIIPIANGLKAASTQTPRDLPTGPEYAALAAIAFRGIMPANEKFEFRPEAPITRSEFAVALARSVHLTSPPSDAAAIADLDPQSMDFDEIAKSIAAGLISLDTKNRFHPDDPLSPSAAAIGLKKLSRLSRSEVDANLDQSITEIGQSNSNHVSRAQVGLLLHQILELP